MKQFCSVFFLLARRSCVAVAGWTMNQENLGSIPYISSPRAVPMMTNRIKTCRTSLIRVQHVKTTLLLDLLDVHLVNFDINPF